MLEGSGGFGVSSSPRFFELAGIPDALREAGAVKLLGKGERITSPDGEWQGCYYVSKGLIGTYGIDAEGNEIMTFLLGKGTLFLESDMLEGAVLAKSDTMPAFIAEEDTELLFVSKPKFRHLMKTDAETANFVACSIAQKMLAFRFLYNEMRSHDIPWRIANLLTAFADNHGVQVGGKVKIEYRISQQLLATMLGANRITVSKGMKRLKDMGLVEKTDEFYYIVSMEHLRAYLDAFQ